MRFSEASSSFPRFRTSCTVVLVLFHVTACFYVKTVFMFQKMKNKQIKKTKQHDAPT